MLTINDAIKKIIKKFENSDGIVKLTRVRKSELGADLVFRLDEEIQFLMLGLGLEHNVELVEVIGNGYVLCVAYISKGCLETCNIVIEL